MSQSQHATWHTLSAEGLSDADGSLVTDLHEVPGLIHAELDSKDGAVEILVEHELAVGDATWVLDDAGYSPD